MEGRKPFLITYPPKFFTMKNKKKSFKNSIGAMILVLTTGLSRVCAARSGGIVSLWLANVDDVTSFTLNASTGEYTAVTMVSGKVFYKFDFKQDTGEWKDDGKMNNGAFSVEHMVETYWENHTQDMRNRAQDLADSSPCGMVGIVLDANGRKWVIGYNEKFLKERPLKLDTQSVASGKAFTDSNGSTPVLKSIDNEYSRTFTGNVPV